MIKKPIIRRHIKNFRKIFQYLKNLVLKPKCLNFFKTEEDINSTDHNLKMWVIWVTGSAFQVLYIFSDVQTEKCIVSTLCFKTNCYEQF